MDSGLHCSRAQGSGTLCCCCTAADAHQMSHHRRAGFAHHLVYRQINDYVLWRLRDQPGQQHLKSFTAQPAVRSDEAGKADSMAAIRSPDGKMMLQQGVSCLTACCSCHILRTHRDVQSRSGHPPPAVDCAEHNKTCSVVPPSLTTPQADSILPNSHTTCSRSAEAWGAGCSGSAGQRSRPGGGGSVSGGL